MTPKLSIWNGSTFTTPTPHVWNGSQFAAPTGCYFWNGATFAQVWPGAPTGVVFDAVGGGSTSGPWSHTINGNSLVVVVHAVKYGGAPSASVKVGTTPVPLLNSWNWLTYSGSFYCSLFLFAMINPPLGAQTITPTVDAASGVWAADSTSYSGVSGFGTAVTATGAVAGDQTGTASVTTPLTAGQIGINAMISFGHQTGSGNFSGYNLTQLYDKPEQMVVSSYPVELLLGFGANTPSVDFSASLYGGPLGASWAAAVLPVY